MLIKKSTSERLHFSLTLISKTLPMYQRSTDKLDKLDKLDDFRLLSLQ